MNDQNEQTGIVLQCDPSGGILRVIRDDLGITRGQHSASTLFGILDPQSRGKAQAFLLAAIDGHAPFGWEFGPGGRLVENAAEQEGIRLMRQLRADGKGFEEMAVHLNQGNVKPKRAEKWARASVGAILKRKDA